MMCSFRLFRVLVAVVVVIAVAPAQDWAHWRGPNYNGAVEAEGLPSDFSKTRGVKWSRGLPGSGASTPIVVGDRIFLTCADSVIERLLAVCLDRKTGKIQWKRAADSGFGGAEGFGGETGGRKPTRRDEARQARQANDQGGPGPRPQCRNRLRSRATADPTHAMAAIV